jgi:hypothetical protein
MQLTIDRKSFIDILSEGQGDISGAMLPPPAGLWGLPPEILQTLPGYGPDCRSEARRGALADEKAFGYQFAVSTTVERAVDIDLLQLVDHDDRRVAELRDVAGRDLDREALVRPVAMLYRARVVGNPRLRHLDSRRRLRPLDHQPGPGLAVVAARHPLLRPDLGRARAGDHRQDRRFVPRRPARHDPRGDHDRQRHRLRRRVMGGRLDIRPVRQLPPRLSVVDRRLCVRRHRLLGLASPTGAVGLTALAPAAIDFRR